MSKNDLQTRFHEEWLGLAQPIEGLVFSVPVLADAQITPHASAELSARFSQALVHTDPNGPGHFGDLRAFFEAFLGYRKPGMLVGRDALPAELHFYAQEGRQDIRPSFAIARRASAPEADALFEGFGDAAVSNAAPDASPYIALVWDVRDDASGPQAALGLSLDRAETTTGTWHYPATAKLERLLRHTGIAIGLLCNGHDLRLMYAPAGETTSHLTFRSSDMQTSAGRPVLAAFELLLSAQRTYQAGSAFTVEGLLRESRKRQADVTKELAAQVFEAVEVLLEAFEQAAARDSAQLKASGGVELDWLRAALEEPDDHLYQGVLSVVLRLVFLLYAEDQNLLPTGHTTYAKHLSIQGLYQDLLEDAGSHPESMHHRFGAYGRLLALFRAMFLGVAHEDLHLPARRGRLFDPSSFPFLEGGLPGSTAAVISPEARAAVRPPSLDDGAVHAVLHRLIVFEGQRLSYRALDVEQIGSVYESLMGYHVLRMESPAVRLGGARVWVQTAELRAQKGAERGKWLKETCELSASQIAKVEAAIKEHAADDALADALNELSPGKKGERERHRVAAGRLVLQPGEERRRSGSHYTPRSLTERIVRRTLEPILKCLGEAPTEAQLLSLKICDPAMGSGAFLVEVTRQLASEVVAAWTREGRVTAIAEALGDPHLHARRLVAQRCVYGVDKNAAAVELAKLSLWLITLSKELPFTFVDHALRHGDSLVGLDLEQVGSFDWKRSKQVPLFQRVLKESLDEALEYRSQLVALAQRAVSESDSDEEVRQEEKRRLLDHAEHATARVRLVADLCVGAFFAEAKDKDREKERARREALVQRWLSGEESVEAELKALAEPIRKRHAPFHWWLEFPEVFYAERPDPLSGGELNGAAFMEAFVGNPPFMGKDTIARANGELYRDWLKATFSGDTGVRGNCDLAAFFLRRSASLVGNNGAFGFISTNTIAQGDTRAIGLKHLVTDGWRLYDAISTMPWPGMAAVIVGTVHASIGTPSSNANVLFDDKLVHAIDSRLSPGIERVEAAPLRANAGFAFQGVAILGTGFLLSEAEMSALISRNERNQSRIRPYLGGQEVNTSPTQMFDRYVINFGQMSEHEAEAWPDLLAVVRDRVKPDRDRLSGSSTAEQRKRYWWRFAGSAPQLYEALSAVDRCLVTARVTKHLCFSFQPTDRVLNEKLYVFPTDSYSVFGVLQSRVHVPWAWLLSSTMKSDLNYSASDCFDTFPFPKPDPRAVLPDVESAGQALYETRARFMLDTNQGLTKTYNALKDPAAEDPRILDLRHLHEAMDRAVLAAYGWQDLEVPPYCPKTPADQAALKHFEDTVVDRLYLLNAERAREEQLAGTATAAKPKSRSATKAPKKKSKSKDETQTTLGIDADKE